MAMQVTTERFEELVTEALEMLPPDLASYMDNVAVMTQEWPTPGQQAGHSGTLLGLYEGVSLTRRSPLTYSGVMPDRITIFRGPHRRLANTTEQLRRRIAVTVVHEIGHHFGISDERLHELGWA